MTREPLEAPEEEKGNGYVAVPVREELPKLYTKQEIVDVLKEVCALYEYERVPMVEVAKEIKEKLGITKD